MGCNPKDESNPQMGTREHTDFSANSGEMAECGSKGTKMKVTDAKLDQAALAKARKFIERSENGGAEESAYPGK
jgi:hypothetical protein